jgi:hypothetical protein
MCAVAANLIRVRRPIPDESGITILGYYFDENAGINGRIYAHEYNSSGEATGEQYTLDLPTTGFFTEFVWSVSNLISWSGLIYDGAPGLTIVEFARGGCWFWRPRTGSLSSRIYHPNLAIQDSVPIYIDGSFYVIRNDSDPGVGTELHRLDSNLETVEIVTTDATDHVSSKPVVASRTHFCKNQHADDATRVLYPLAGGAVSRESLATLDKLGAPYSLTQTIIAGTSRFPRLVNVVDDTVDHLWPDESPWLPQNQASRVQFADPYILGFEFLTGGARRVILGRFDDGVDDSPVADFQIPSQGGISAFLAGIGNLP